MPRTLPLLRYVCVAGLVAVGVRHGVLAAMGSGDVGRHAVFVALDFVLAALLVLRPRWAFYPALALGGQQVWSHGLDLSRSFLGDAGLDWSSVAVCAFFPTLVTVLWIERNEDAEDASG